VLGISWFWSGLTATLAGVIGCANANACACICPLGLLGTPRSLLLRQGGLRPVWALIPGQSLQDLPLVGACYLGLRLLSLLPRSTLVYT